MSHNIWSLLSRIFLDYKCPLLEKEIAAHSGILVWEILRTEELWWATIHGVTKELDTTEWLNNNALIC